MSLGNTVNLLFNDVASWLQEPQTWLPQWYCSNSLLKTGMLNSFSYVKAWWLGRQSAATTSMADDTQILALTYKLTIKIQSLEIAVTAF